MRVVALLLISLSMGNLMAQELDSIRAVAMKIEDHDQRLSYLIEVSTVYHLTDPVTGVALARMARNLAYSLNDTLNEVRAMHKMGRAMEKQSQWDSSLLVHREILEIIKDMPGKSYDVERVAAYNSIGVSYYYKGSYDAALEILFKSLALAETLQEARSIKNTTDILGLVYWKIGELDLALEQLNRSVAIYETLTTHNNDDVANFAGNLTNLASIYYEQGNMDKVLEYDLKSLEIQESIDNSYGISIACNNLGEDYALLGNYAKAKTYFLRSLEIRMSVNNLRGAASTLLNLASLSTKQGDFTTAINYADEAIAVSNTIDAPDIRQRSYEELHKIEIAQGNYKQALEYFKQGDAIGDSLIDERKNESMVEIREKYEAEQREQQILLQQEQLASQKFFRNALIGGIGLLIIVAALIYRNERIKTKKNREIESLLKEIHHRVKNNLQVISSLLNMQARGVDDDEVLDTIKEGQSRVKAMSLIHQKLYQTESISEIDLQEYISELADQLKDLYLGQEADINTEVSAENVKLDLDTAIPLALILNELISNAYKYAFEGIDSGEIKINLERLKGNQLKLEVSDNGKGLPKGIDLGKVKSLGLKLVNILTRQLKGTLSYSADQGTKFTISFIDLKMGA